VKRDVPGFIPKYKGTHGAGGGIIDVPAQNTIIRAAHEFCEQQHLQFKANAHDSSARAEGGETPVRIDQAAAKAADRATQETRVLFFFREPKVDEGSHAFRTAPESLSIIRNERRWSSAVAELEALKGRQDLRDGADIEVDGRIPIRFFAIELILPEARDPEGCIHNVPELLCTTK
jgi:hypothetical protein